MTRSYKLLEYKPRKLDDNYIDYKLNKNVKPFLLGDLKEEVKMTSFLISRRSN
jgi:hypothetical protein